MPRCQVADELGAAPGGIARRYAEESRGRSISDTMSARQSSLTLISLHHHAVAVGQVADERAAQFRQGMTASLFTVAFAGASPQNLLALTPSSATVPSQPARCSKCEHGGRSTGAPRRQMPAPHPRLTTQQPCPLFPGILLHSSIAGVDFIPTLYA